MCQKYENWLTVGKFTAITKEDKLQDYGALIWTAKVNAHSGHTSNSSIYSKFRHITNGSNRVTWYVIQESCAKAKMTAQCALHMGALEIFGTA